MIDAGIIFVNVYLGGFLFCHVAVCRERSGVQQRQSFCSGIHWFVESNVKLEE